MAIVSWVGKALAVKQIDTITVANTWATGDFANIIINGKTLSLVIGTSATTAAVAASLVAMVNGAALGAGYTSNTLGSLVAEFQEVTATLSGSTCILTANTAGIPFTATVSETTAGSGTLATAATQACSGPNFANVAANYSGNAVPSNGDTLILENNSVSILYGLDLSAVTLAALIVRQSYTGYVGLPKTNATGSYPEYRPQYLKLSATAIDYGQGDGSGTGRFKIDLGTVQTTANVHATGSEIETGVECLLILGTHASNALNVNRGKVGVAVFADEVSTIATWKSGYVTNKLGDVTLHFGSGVTWTSGVQTGGTLDIASNGTTITKHGGTLIHRAGTLTTITNNEGPIIELGAGTITTYKGAKGSKFDKSRDLRAQTITNCTLLAGAEFDDPGGVVVPTNGIILQNCTLADVKLNLGANRTLTPS